MPIDIRYHAVSLLAVFLALALGILVGFAMVDPGQIRQFVEAVKKDNEHTRTQNREELESLRQQTKICQSFEKALLPLAVKGRLEGKRVALLLDHDPGRNSPAPILRKVLENSGGRLTAVVLLYSRFGRLKDEEADRIFAGRGIVCPPGTDKRSFLAGRIGRRIAEGGSDLPRYLEEEGLIGLSSRSDFSQSVDAVVVVGGSTLDSQFVEDVEEPMLRAIEKSGRRLVGCELSQDSGAAVEFFQRLDLPTVDCVDTYPGQVALVLALAGKDGNFGTKESADRLLPDLE